MRRSRRRGASPSSVRISSRAIGSTRRPFGVDRTRPRLPPRLFVAVFIDVLGTPRGGAQACRATLMLSSSRNCSLIPPTFASFTLGERRPLTGAQAGPLTPAQAAEHHRERLTQTDYAC